MLYIKTIKGSEYEVSYRFSEQREKEFQVNVREKVQLKVVSASIDIILLFTSLEKTIYRIKIVIWILMSIQDMYLTSSSF